VGNSVCEILTLDIDMLTEHPVRKREMIALSVSVSEIAAACARYAIGVTFCT
jgi:hypothetical protein